jgi:hypothetical protein
MHYFKNVHSLLENVGKKLQLIKFELSGIQRALTGCPPAIATS